MGEDRSEALSRKADWSSGSLESEDKKESNEISGYRERIIPTQIICFTLIRTCDGEITRKRRAHLRLTPLSVRLSVCLSTEDTLNFWKGIADVGLLGEVVTNISTELLELLNGVQQRREPAGSQDTGTEPHLCTLAAWSCVIRTDHTQELGLARRSMKRETNGKKEQIQLLLGADGREANTRKLLDWLLSVSVTIMTEYLMSDCLQQLNLFLLSD